ncbi:Hypothetical protein ACI5QL_00769 [Bacillus velezensis]
MNPPLVVSVSIIHHLNLNVNVNFFMPDKLGLDKTFVFKAPGDICAR